MPIFVYVWSRRAEQVTTSPGLCGNDPRRRRSECDERSSRLAAILAVRTYPGANPGASRPSIAAGEYSAILGGSGNSACSTYDAIGTGEDNTIGLQSTAASPYIGACQGNAVDALAAQLHA